MHSSERLFAVAFTALALIAGCGQKQETSQTSIDTTAVAPAMPPPEAMPSGTPAWVAQIRQGEAELGRTVEEGRLGEVHDQAVKLQGLLKEVSAQAGSLAPDQQQQLNGHVSAAGRVVDELHDAGDAGDLTKTRAKFQEFQTYLRAIEGLFGVAAP
jgi:hypothetical protein